MVMLVGGAYLVIGSWGYISSTKVTRATGCTHHNRYTKLICDLYLYSMIIISMSCQVYKPDCAINLIIDFYTCACHDRSALCC